MPGRLLLLLTTLLWMTACGSQTREDELDQCAGEYGLDQLGPWNERARALQGENGVTSVGMHPVLDCIAVGVQDSSFVQTVEARLRELGIPRNAVVIATAQER